MGYLQLGRIGHDCEYIFKRFKSRPIESIIKRLFLLKFSLKNWMIIPNAQSFLKINGILNNLVRSEPYIGEITQSDISGGGAWLFNQPLILPLRYRSLDVYDGIVS